MVFEASNLLLWSVIVALGLMYEPIILSDDIRIVGERIESGIPFMFDHTDGLSEQLI